MLIAEESKSTTAALATGWALWRDVSNWKTWDPDVEWSLGQVREQEAAHGKRGDHHDESYKQQEFRLQTH